jgi:hypothetical protein
MSTCPAFSIQWHWARHSARLGRYKGPSSMDEGLRTIAANPPQSSPQFVSVTAWVFFSVSLSSPVSKRHLKSWNRVPNAWATCLCLSSLAVLLLVELLCYCCYYYMTLERYLISLNYLEFYKLSFLSLNLKYNLTYHRY